MAASNSSVRSAHPLPDGFGEKIMSTLLQISPRPPQEVSYELISRNEYFLKNVNVNNDVRVISVGDEYLFLS